MYLDSNVGVAFWVVHVDYACIYLSLEVAASGITYREHDYIYLTLYLVIKVNKNISRNKCKIFWDIVFSKQ